MKTRNILSLIALAVILMSFNYSSTRLNSNIANVTIPANQEFVLGEYQTSNYKAKLNNKGNAILEIKILNKQTNEQTQGFGLDPKGEATVYVSKDEKVVLQNNSDKDMLVKVKLNKTVEGMRYQEVGEFEK